MALNNEQLIELVNSIPVYSYKSAVSKKPMALTKHMADALGVKKRNLLRYTKIAIQTIANKLEIKEFAAINTTEIDEWLTANAFQNLQKDLYKSVSRDGCAFILVSHDGVIPQLKLVESYDGYCGAYAYEDEYTVNVWYEDKQKNLDIYYPDRIEKYFLDTNDNLWKQRRDVPGESWPFDWTKLNGEPLGIALIRFDINESDVTEAVQLQHDLNEAYVDLLAVSRTQGFPQRVLKNASQETFLLNQYGQPLLDLGTGNSYPIPRDIELTPASILMLQGKESSLEQLPSASADMTVLDYIERLVSEFTSVPLHYFKGDWPSGVALQNAEMRLDSKIENHQALLSPSFVSMLRLMLALSNKLSIPSTNFDAEQTIEVLWFEPQIYTADLVMEQEKNRVANVAVLKLNGLISVETAIRYLYPQWDDTQIKAEVDRIQNEQTTPVTL